MAVGTLSLLPARGPAYNRFWQIAVVPPGDLAMHRVIGAAGSMPAVGRDANSPFGDKVPLTTWGVSFVLESVGRTSLPAPPRIAAAPPASVTDRLFEELGRLRPDRLVRQPFWAEAVLHTPSSQAAFLSGHWLPSNVALNLSTQVELFDTPLKQTAEPENPRLWLEWTAGPEATRFDGPGAGAPVERMVEDRGPLNAATNSTRPVAGERLVLTPVLDALANNGWRVALHVTGPDSFRRVFEARQRPARWTLANFAIQFPEPGSYAIEVEGTVAWPTRTYCVSYTLVVAPRLAGRDRR